MFNRISQEYKLLGLYIHLFMQKWDGYFLPQVPELHTKDDYLRLRSDIEKRTAYAVDVLQKVYPHLL